MNLDTHFQEKMDQIIAGDHMVLLYDEKDAESNAEIIAYYIISRIRKNERCFYVSGDVDNELILKTLRLSIDLEEVIAKRQLTILDKNDAYAKDGKFNPQKMIKLLKTLAINAIQDGYNAFAITGEISWVLDYEDGFARIMDYEYMLNEEIFGSYPVSAICRYNIDKFSSSMIKNIIEVHPIVIWKKQIHENPYYFEIVNTENMDIEQFQVNSMLKTIMKYTSSRARFMDELEDKEKKVQELQLNLLKTMIVSLTELLEIHDEYTKNHNENVANISKMIAKAMNFSDEETNQLYYAGLVHDIGKAVIPKEIINKNGKLNEEEYAIIKQHPLYGHKALVKSEVLNHISNIVLQHHERWDGKGYPNGIKGETIMYEARIIAIVDAYDAMTSDRPYRKALSKEESINEIKENAGKQFDPDIARFAIEKVFEYM
jgi:HD-GYP domain-containing protein (c-di-GMP phosphodiesterase class II)